MIRLLLVDDQDILVEGLKLILGMEDDIEICATANNGIKAYEACKWNRPDVITHGHTNARIKWCRIN